MNEGGVDEGVGEGEGRGRSQAEEAPRAQGGREMVLMRNTESDAGHDVFLLPLSGEKRVEEGEKGRVKAEGREAV